MVGNKPSKNSRAPVGQYRDLFVWIHGHELWLTVFSVKNLDVRYFARYIVLKKHEYNKINDCAICSAQTMKTKNGKQKGSEKRGVGKNSELR